MTKALPEHPSLTSLRYEAKQILKAHRQRRPNALATLRHHPKFADKPDGEIQGARIVLQDVQHALAREYGFRDWAALLTGIDPERSEARFERFQEEAHQLLSDYWNDRPEALGRVSKALSDISVQRRLPPHGTENLRWLDDALEVIAFEQGATSWAELQFKEVNEASLTIKPEGLFADAVRKNDLNVVRGLLDEDDAYANARIVGSPFRFDGTGWIPGNERALLPDDDPRTCAALHYASSNPGHSDLARLLIEFGADVDAPCHEGRPVDLAAWEGDLATLTILLEAGADPNGVGRHASGPLYTALEHRSPEKAEVLRRFGANHTTHTAAISGDVVALEKLIEDKPGLLEFRSGRNRTPLQEAAFYGQTNTAEVLIRAGATVVPEVAVGLGMRDEIERAIKADPDAVRKLFGTQPLLCWATTSDQVEVIDDLIAKGADPNQGDQWGVTALRYAKSAAAVERLVAGGADVNLDTRGFTPLAEKMWKGPLDAARALVRLGAQVDQPCSWLGHTPLHKAVIADPFNGAALRWLLDQGADPSIADESGMTPVDYANRDGVLEAVEILTS